MSEIHSRDDPENVNSAVSEDAIPPPEENIEEDTDQTEHDNPEDRPDGGESPDGESARNPKQSRKKPLLKILKNVCEALIVSAAAVVLIVYFFFPVMRIYGSSMSSTLVDGDIVIARKTTKLERGDICAFYYGNRILCKRVIGLAGDSIEIDPDGTVHVNGVVQEEPYLKGKSLGQCEITFPYTVPENSYFVLGDNRRVSIDSRHNVIGCVSEEQMVGKLMFCILPLPSFGIIH